MLHIGIPLTLMLALWVHIQRISEADVFPSRALALGTFVMLLVLAFVKPTVSHGKADLSVVPAVLHIDWYYLFIHPLMYLTSPAGLLVNSCANYSRTSSREAGTTGWWITRLTSLPTCALPSSL